MPHRFLILSLQKAQLYKDTKTFGCKVKNAVNQTTRLATSLSDCPPTEISN